MPIELEGVFYDTSGLSQSWRHISEIRDKTRMNGEQSRVKLNTESIAQRLMPVVID
jgi:hypothetical protein